MSDIRTPAIYVPPCATCEKPSIGGVIREMEGAAAAGSPIMTVEFFCHDCTPGPFGVMSSRLFPAYRIIHAYNASRLKIIRLSRAAQAERLQE